VNKRSVDAAKPGARDAFIWDDAVVGFGLKVTPSGRKTYVVQYRPAGLGRRGTVKRVTLGDHGKLTPNEARREARRL
jgi:hypothetical protein